MHCIRITIVTGIIIIKSNIRNVLKRKSVKSCLTVDTYVFSGI